MKKLIFLSLSIILFTLTTPVFGQGYSLTPGIEEYTLNPSQTKQGSIHFKNHENMASIIIITVDTYDPKTEEILKKEPFIKAQSKSLTVQPDETVSINYTASIPENTPAGSYFNIVTVEEKISEGESGANLVNIKKGVGAIIGLHVVESENSIENIFFQESNTLLVIKNKGLPYLSKMEVEYTYTNNSDFVFRPEGEIRIIDNEGKQISDRYEINAEKEAIYPGETVTQTIHTDTWSPEDVLGSRDIIARTYSGYGENYVTDKATVTIKNSVYIIGGLSALVILIPSGLLLRTVLKRRKKKSQNS